MLWIVSERALECRLRLGGDDAVRFGEQRLAEIGLAVGARAVDAQRVAPRFHGIVETPKPHVNGADDLPATPIVRILLQMGLDIRNQPVERAILQGRRIAAGKRLTGQLRRAEGEIKAGCDERHRHKSRDGRNPAAQGSARRARLGCRRLRGTEQAARDFHARSLSFGRTDEPG